MVVLLPFRQIVPPSLISNWATCWTPAAWESSSVVGQRCADCGFDARDFLVRKGTNFTVHFEVPICAPPRQPPVVPADPASSGGSHLPPPGCVIGNEPERCRPSPSLSQRETEPTRMQIRQLPQQDLEERSSGKIVQWRHR